MQSLLRPEQVEIIERVEMLLFTTVVQGPRKLRVNKLRVGRNQEDIGCRQWHASFGMLGVYQAGTIVRVYTLLRSPPITSFHRNNKFA